MNSTSAFKGLACVKCNEEFGEAPLLNLCKKCGGPLDTLLDDELLLTLRKEHLPKTGSMWRYRPFLPLREGVSPVSAGEGDTPLRRLRSFEGVVLVKDETRNPTGTFKDRGASLAVSILSALGVKKIVLSSEGNAGCSFALYSKMAGMECHVFLPKQVNPAKLDLSKRLGADVSQVNGTIANAGRQTERIWNVHGV